LKNRFSHLPCILDLKKGVEQLAYLSDDEYETEKKNIICYHNLLEIPIIIFFFIGVFTAVFNITINGLTPTVWFLLSFWCILVIICMK
jgi:hypothetical protein